MTNAAKHFDPQIGIDIHMYEMPPGPLPTAHISIVLDPFDYLPFIGATVQVAGVKRAIAGTGGLSVHIPLGMWMPPMRAPEGPQFDDELFMGSKTVLADDSPFSRLGMPVLDCSVVGMVPPFRLKKPEKPHMSMSMPTAVNLAIPDTVFIGGPPTISMMAIATKLGFAALGKGFKALRKTKGFQRAEEAFKKARQKLFKNMEPGFLKCKILRAEPVDIRDGSVAVSQEDFSIPGRLPLTWSRAYSSSNTHDGICGFGWQTPADFRLEIEPDGIVLFYEANGAAIFPHMPDAVGADHAVIEFVDGARLSWIKNDGLDELQVVTKDDLCYIFHKPAASIAPLHRTLHLHIERIEDLCGNHWRFERVDGHLTRVIESGANELPGRFIEVHESGGKIHQLHLHDPATGLNHPLTAYKYQNQDLVAALDALDSARTFGYDQHRMVRHTDRLGLSFYYTYDSGWRVIHTWGDRGLHDYHFKYDDTLRETEVIDSLGHVSLIKFDQDNLPLCEIDPLGGVTIFEYDEAGRTTAVVDQIGLRTEFEYDERGNLLKLVYPDGSAMSAVFDNANRISEIVDPLGQRWRQSWDKRGLLLQQQTPMGASSHYEYDALGQLYTYMNPRGAITTLSFDRYGNLLSLTDALGHQSHFEHDALGSLRRTTNPADEVAEYRYDVKGRLLQVIQAGADAWYEYDAEDQLISYVDENQTRTRLEYFGTGQVAKRLQADGYNVQYLYDSEERLVGVVNQQQETFQIKRDALGRVEEEIDYWGQSCTYRYDAAGRPLGSSDPLGKIISYQVDRRGRIIKKILSDDEHPDQQSYEVFSYDKRGAVIEMRNPYRHILRKFDADGRLSEEMQDGFRIENSYDEMGNRLLLKTSAGNTIASVYDLCNRVASIAINGGPAIVIERDALGRTVKEQLNGTIDRNLQYDHEGHLSSQTVLRGQISLFETHYQYDRAGNQTHRQDSEHGTDFYHYDLLGNLLRHTDPAGRITEFLNDPAGDRLRTRIRQAEMKQAASGEMQADALWVREGSHDGKHYVFDRAGNLIQSGDSQISPKLAVEQADRHPDLQLRWDASQRLIESRKAGQVTRYGYDAFGRRVFKRNAEYTTWFFWDGEALLGDVTQSNHAAGGDDIWVANNVADLMAARRRLNALKTLHLQVREFVYYPGTFVPLALIDHQFKKKKYPNGLLEKEVQSATQEYDIALLPLFISPEKKSGFGGLGAGDGLGVKSLQSKDQYALTSQGFPLGALGDANASYRLGAENGLSLGSGIANSPMPGTQSGIDSNDAIDTRVEIRAEALDKIVEVPGSDIFYFHNDPNGCPTRLTDGTGQIVWAVSYTVWGEVKHKYASAIDNPIRFQGQYYDAETGLHYNLNRYYDSHIGSFISQDPIGLIGGLNVYQYGPNPIGWIDPWGLEPHNATMTVYAPDGSTRFTEPLTSGGATGPSWPEQIASHTESKGVRDPRIKTGDRVVFTNATMTPCSGCRGNMNDASVAQRLDIEYYWNDGNGKSGIWKTDPKKAEKAVNARIKRNKRKALKAQKALKANPCRL
ncbi:RHS repeat-associated core domain-containing protein [Collimonas humicola]|uniref:RHS repeat-associated core domain-containing protein n=1 Tax=Collimonas humicola TaxID=2825886 RepID=UPI001B8AF5EA|nr:RHS repeat-associated core domain-containing protein [Collimonas humicola]